MEFYRKATELLSFGAGLLLIIFAIILTVLIFNNPYPDESSPPQILGGLILALFILFLGLPGLLSKILKDIRKKNLMLKINGFILSMFIIAFPVFLAAPVGFALAVFFLAAAGLWIILYSYHSEKL